MKYIFSKRQFIIRTKILELVGEEQNLPNLHKILLLNETTTQRTYMVKTDTEFFIVNDNRGDVQIALRRSLELLKFSIYDNPGIFLLKFEGITPAVKVSKIIFENSADLTNKINSL